MARKKKESTPGENLAKQIIEQYNPKSVAGLWLNEIKSSSHSKYRVSVFPFTVYTVSLNLVIFNRRVSQNSEIMFVQFITCLSDIFMI